MVKRGEAREAAQLLCAAAMIVAWAAPVAAQTTAPAPAAPAPQPRDSAELDPSAPLDPMPGLGVAWPDLNGKDQPVAMPAPSVAGSVPAATAAPTDTSAIADTVSERRYSIAVEGLANVDDGEALLTAFRKQSVLEADRKHAANAAQIDRRSRADADLLAELLRSRGYYDALVDPAIEQAAGAIRVTFAASPGAQYRFSSVELPGIDAAGTDAAKLRAAFAVKTGDAVIAEDVIAGGAALKTALGERGFALATIGAQDIAVDHSTHLATLVLPVAPGPVARFGAIRVDGKPPFSARHVATIARFRRGDRFERSKIDDLRRALIATSLVSVAEVKVVPEADGRTVDLAVRLEPAPRHTIAGDIGYGTGEGIRAEVSWQDRNFFNPEGALTLRGIAGTKEQLAAAQFRASNFRQRDQVLNLQASVGHTKYAAYEAKTVLLSAGIERLSNIIWQKKWTWTAGGEVLATRERGAFDASLVKDTRNFLIVALPASLGYDSSDDLLDPTRGFRLGGRLSPEISAIGGKFAYARAQIDASTYHRFNSSTVIAGRIRLGTILGASSTVIAPSRRFYSGGGGSVRGYGYQQLGPKDLDGDPTGGRGLAEFGLEARIRLKQFGGNFGIVPFVDGGSLTTRALPDFSRFRLAAGLGARYYSSFGPIRVDVGVPLHREQGDGPVAVTVSIGQAF